MKIINYYLKACIIFTLLITSNLAFSATITSAANGDWDVGATWAGGVVPGAGDDVIIKHVITLTSAKTINSLSIINDVSDATLDINTNGDLTVTTNVTLLGTNTAFNTAFDVENGNATVGGNFTITDNNTNSKYVRLKMDNASTLDVSGNFTYTRNVTSGSSSSLEIWMGNTAGSAPVLDIGGEFKIDYQASTGNSDNLTVRLSKGSLITTGDFTIDYNNSKTGDVFIDIGQGATDQAQIIVTGTTTLNHNSSNSGNEINIRTHGSPPAGSANFVTGNLIMTSLQSTGGTNNIIQGYEDSKILVDGNLTFNVASSAVENRIQMNNSSILEFKGDIINPNNGDVEFLNTSELHMTGSGIQTLPEAKSDNYTSITINNTSGTAISLDDDVIISGHLTLIQGVVASTITNTITFDSGATSDNGDVDSYLTGPVKREGTTDFTYPLGDGAYFAPMKLANIAGGNASTVFTAEYIQGTPPNTTSTSAGLEYVSGWESWDVSAAVSIPTSADITLYYESAVNSDITDVTTGASQDLFLGLYDGSQWNDQATSIGNSISGSSPTPLGTGAETGSITATINTFNLLTFASKNGNNPLPIELISFAAQPNDNKVDLLWSTASEINNAYFDIEKASGNLIFNKIGIVEGSNNSNEVLHYSFEDPAPLTGITYYRLKQVDFDGSFEYSPVISIDLYNNNPLAVLYPNPLNLYSSNKLYIKFNNPEIRERMHVDMINILGAVVYSDFVSIVNNQSYIELDYNIPSGIYIVVLNDGDNISRRRITIK